MSKIFGLLSLAIGGMIVADILIHPVGTAAASKGITNIQRPIFNAILGTPS